MAKVKPQFECKWCRRMFRRDELNKHHGRFTPKCMAYRTYDWLHENDYAYPGRDEAVLRMAGLIRMVAVQAWYVEIFEVEVQKKNRVEKEKQWVHHELVEYVPTAPRWALKMARQLVEDQAIIQRLKIGRRQKRVGTVQARKRQNEGLAKDFILMIPIEVRAQILASAASNPIVHAMVTDEQGGLETAIIVARDLKKKVGS